MTHLTGRRALLQSAAAALGGAILPGIAGTTSSQAQSHGVQTSSRGAASVGYGAAFWLIALVFVTAMAFSAVPTPLYPLYQALDGFSTITIVFAVYVVGVLISLMLAGQLSDVIGRKRVLVAALILELAGAAFAVTRRLRAMGIRDKPISPGSPWQNCFAERLIGTIRRECVDHVVALGEQHLRQVVKSYAGYYNTARTHRSLDKDPPVSRPVQRIGRIVSHAMVGGLHHQYVRI